MQQSIAQRLPTVIYRGYPHAMRIVTWNVNSIKARLPRVVAWLSLKKPDIVCLQETKVQDHDFPHEALHQVGYHAVVHGQAAYNGVALLAPLGTSFDGVIKGLPALKDDSDAQDTHARFIFARIKGIDVASAYVPNGQSMDSDKATYKLRWYERLAAFVQGHNDANRPFVVAGDFNVAPKESDIAHPDRWRDTVLFHPKMQAALHALFELGLIDVFAKHHPQGGVFSWWNYRHLGFAKNDGLRIDLLLANPMLSARSQEAWVDRDERKGERPSDHAPVGVRFMWP